MPLWKRLGLVAGFAVIAVGIAYALYAVFFKPAAPPAAGPGVIERPGALPTARPGLPRAVTAPPPREAAPSPTARGGLTLAATVVSTRAVAPTIAADGRSLAYYDPARGIFYRVDEQGDQRALSDKKFFNVENVAWAPGQDQAIIEYPDGSNISFNFQTQTQVTLPKHWEGFAFTPDGSAIGAKSIGEDPENRWLIAANPDGSGATPIEPLGNNADKVAVSWSPNKDIIAFSKTGSEIGFGREEIIPIGLRGENLRSLAVEGFGFQSQWSPDGRRLVYSVYNQDNGYRPELWVVDAGGDRLGANRRRLNLGTWADKCVAASAAALYCAVPVNLPEGAGFERSIANESPDRLYRVDLATGSRTLLAEPEPPGTFGQLMLSRDGKTLFLQDAGSGSIRKMNLP